MVVILTFTLSLIDKNFNVNLIITFSDRLDFMKAEVKKNEPIFTIWAGPLPYVVLTKAKDMEVGDWFFKFLSIFLEIKELILHYFMKKKFLLTKIMHGKPFIFFFFFFFFFFVRNSASFNQ